MLTALPGLAAEARRPKISFIRVNDLKLVLG